MAAAPATTSKNDPQARKKTEGWRCPECGHDNRVDTRVCAGTRHTLLVQPNGRGFRSGMTHEPCGKVK